MQCNTVQTKNYSCQFIPKERRKYRVKNYSDSRYITGNVYEFLQQQSRLCIYKNTTLHEPRSKSHWCTYFQTPSLFSALGTGKETPVRAI
uniref:Uncharacterized protein n=1 Tax=Daucus carota subsp. sativus TaxID=79200 RepID=A0A164VTI9_DAUCS